MGMGLRILAIVAIIIGMPLAAWWFVFVEQNQQIESATKELKHKESLLVKLQEETSRNADLVKANEEIQRSVKMIEARLPSNKEVDAIVRQVSDLAVQAGLNPPAMKSGKPVQAAGYMEQPLEMEVTGDFLGFFTFIAHVEKLPRITRIHDLKITGMLKDDVEMKAEFTLSIYFQDEKSVAHAEVK